MCEVFLLRDLGPFELSVCGDVRGSGAALAISAVLDHLPRDTDVVVDLRHVVFLDLDAAGALARDVERRNRDDVRIVVLATDPWISRLLLGVGLPSARLVADDRAAHRLLAELSLCLAS